MHTHAMRWPPPKSEALGGHPVNPPLKTSPLWIHFFFKLLFSILKHCMNYCPIIDEQQYFMVHDMAS
jgi:hypothetical protein